jgi:hypothetical protein
MSSTFGIYTFGAGIDWAVAKPGTVNNVAANNAAFKSLSLIAKPLCCHRLHSRPLRQHPPKIEQNNSVWMATQSANTVPTMIVYCTIKSDHSATLKHSRYFFSHESAITESRDAFVTVVETNGNLMNS